MNSPAILSSNTGWLFACLAISAWSAAGTIAAVAPEMSFVGAFEALRWLVGLPLTLFGAYVIGFNWATIPWNVRRARAGIPGHVSAIPIAGPLAATIGLGALLWGLSPHYVWVWLVD